MHKIPIRKQIYYLIFLLSILSKFSGYKEGIEKDYVKKLEGDITSVSEILKGNSSVKTSWS